MFYAAKIEKDIDLGFIVSFPDFPNINAFGKTKSEALKKAKEALDSTLECEFDMGLTFRHPITAPDVEKGLYPIELSQNVEVAYKLLEARRGMKKSQVAKRAGITPQAYQRLENVRGKSMMNLDTLYKIANAMGKRLEWELV